MLGCETVVNCAKKGAIDAGGGQLLKQILDASCNKTTMEALDKQVNGILYGDPTLKELIPSGKIIESIVNNLTENIEKHDELNPKLWVDNSLKTEVRAKILEISNEFIKALQEDGIKFNLNDIQIVGSNCSYNYTKDSDLDVHLIADSSSLNCPDNLYPLLYSSYRSIFNKNLSIDFYGIPVELYVEVESGKASTNAKSNGIYSVLSNK